MAFVVSVTMAKEAYDDICRWKRDREANNERFERLTDAGFVSIPSSDIKVGHLIKLSTNQRVIGHFDSFFIQSTHYWVKIPADMIMLRTSEKPGASFIRTDQLDGETDWKLRSVSPFCYAICLISFSWWIDGGTVERFNTRRSWSMTIYCSDWPDRFMVGCHCTDLNILLIIIGLAAEKPRKDIYSFVGNFSVNPPNQRDVRS